MAGTDAKTEMVEIVNIVPRRRWTTEKKLRMVAACEEPGKSVSGIAAICLQRPCWRTDSDEKRREGRNSPPVRRVPYDKSQRIE